MTATALAPPNLAHPGQAGRATGHHHTTCGPWHYVLSGRRLLVPLMTPTSPGGAGAGRGVGVVRQ
jgi:hypothetical protein